jgi:nucleoside-diphosphate-sugar epimerase
VAAAAAAPRARKPGEFSIRALAEAVTDLVGASSRYAVVDRRPSAKVAGHRLKANELLDWKPTVALRDITRQDGETHSAPINRQRCEIS